MTRASTATPQDRTAASATDWTGHLALLVVQLCFGLFPVLVKFALLGLTPRALASWRMLTGASILGALVWWRFGRRAVPGRRDLVLLLLCSALGVVANQVLALEGFARSTAVNAGLIMTLIPVFSFGLAALAGQERFDLRRAAGLPLGLLGAGILLSQRAETPELTRQYLTGNLLMAANTLCYAAYLVLSRRLLARHHPTVVIAWVYLLSLWAVPFLLRGESLVIEPGPDARAAWAGLAFVLAFPTVLAYLLNTFALSRVPVSVTAVYIYLQPLIATAGGVVILGESVPAALLPSALCMFAAIALVTARSKVRVGAADQSSR